MSTSAAAPSVICDELPAVMVPAVIEPVEIVNAGRNPASPSTVVSARTPSSTLTTVSPRLPAIVYGAISSPR